MPATIRLGAATAVPVLLSDMDKVIRRGFRALRPRVEKARWGETLYILTPDEEDPDSVIRVQTSIAWGQQEARSEGKDSIRIVIFNTKTNRPMAGKFPLIMRTQNWKDNLRSRIEDAIEKYEDLREQKTRGVVVKEEEEERDPEPPPPQHHDRGGRPAEASYTRLRSGDWGLRIIGDVEPGDRVLATRQSGQSQLLTVGEVVFKGQDRGTFVTVSTIGRALRTAGETETCACGGTGVRADGEPCCGGCQQGASSDPVGKIASSGELQEGLLGLLRIAQGPYPPRILLTEGIHSLADRLAGVSPESRKAANWHPKIASSGELQKELQRILRIAQSPNPSRVGLAEELRVLGDRLPH